MASGVANFELVNPIKNLRGGIERAKRGRRWVLEGSPSEVKFTLLILVSNTIKQFKLRDGQSF